MIPCLISNRSITVVTGVQWHKVSYYEWTHPKNVAPSSPQRTIICWHGLARNAHDFDVLAQHLVKNIPNARVIAIDTPGRGESENLILTATYNLQTYAIVFSALYNALGAPPAIEWVGISMGGLLGMLLTAASANCAIKKLVLVDIGPFVGVDAVKRIGEYVGTDPTFDSLKDVERYLRQIYNLMGDDITDEQWAWMASKFSKPKGEKLGLHYDPAIRDAFKGTEPKDIEMWVIWDMIKTPIMLYHGEKSDILTFETVEQMKSRGPKLEHLVSFPDQGHTPHLFNYKQCEKIIQWFK